MNTKTNIKSRLVLAILAVVMSFNFIACNRTEIENKVISSFCVPEKNITGCK